MTGAPPLSLRARLARVGLLSWAALAIAWTMHVWSTVLGDPWGVTLDLVLYTSAMVLRVICVVSLVMLLAQAHRSIARSRHRALRAARIWGLVTVLFVISLAATRETWVPYVNDGSARHYLLDSPRPTAIVPPPNATPLIGRGVQDFHSEMARHHERWRADWRRGLVLGTDLALALTLCVIQCCVGFFFGDRRWSWLLGVASFYGVAAAYLAVCPWFLMDYDNFHGEIFAGALVFDHLLVLGSRPYTSISVVFYLAALVALLAVRPPAVGLVSHTSREDLRPPGPVSGRV